MLRAGACARVTCLRLPQVPGLGKLPPVDPLAVETLVGAAPLQRNWSTLGPKLQGKLHIYCGSADNFFLNDAVYLVEDFLKTTTNPPYDGEVKYGDRAEHCWNGDPTLPNYLSRLHYNTQYLPKILDRIAKTAPPGADLTSWRY